MKGKQKELQSTFFKKASLYYTIGHANQYLICYIINFQPSNDNLFENEQINAHESKHEES